MRLLLFAALLLIIPGFATDIIGFLMIFPPLVNLCLVNLQSKCLKKKINEDFIEGESEDIDDKMSDKFKILSGYVKDLSSETPNVESYLYTKDNISKYELDIDINSKPLKNKLIEVNTTLKFQDKKQVEKNHILKL